MKKIGKVGMTIDWSKPVHLYARSDHTLPADNMHRAEHAKFLTDFLIAKAENTNYVLNVIAGWGAGKNFLSKTMQARDRRVFKKILRNYSEVIKENHPAEQTYGVNSAYKYHFLVKNLVYIFHHGHDVRLRS